MGREDPIVRTYEVYELRDLGRMWTYLAVRARRCRTVVQAIEDCKATAYRKPELQDAVLVELQELAAEGHERVYDLHELDDAAPDFKIRWEQVHRAETKTTWGEPEVTHFGRRPSTVLANAAFLQHRLVEGRVSEIRKLAHMGVEAVLETPVAAMARLEAHRGREPWGGFQRVQTVRFDPPASVYLVDFGGSNV
jgi:hypothetical protein